MSEQKDKKKKTGTIVGIIIGVIIIALLAVIIYLLLHKPDDDGIPNRGLIDNSNREEVTEAINDKVAEGMFECKMTTSWTFEDGKATSKDAYVANAEANTHTICFDVVDEATGEVWYQSPFMKVGEEMHGIKLDKELPAGEYSAIVQYKLLNEKEDGTYEESSSAGFKVIITVLK
jgi:hypothetical protein